jgi:hypothetical protein
VDQQRIDQVNRFIKNNSIIDRATWGASESKIPDTPESQDWDYTVVVIHHSGGSGDTNPVAIQSKHLNKGWDDVGYHFMVGPGGQVFEGRRLYNKGSHVELANTGKLGILVMGCFENFWWKFWSWVAPPSQTQLDGVIRLVKALKGLFPSITTLGGHKDYKVDTECPGGELYLRLDDLRNYTGLAAPLFPKCEYGGDLPPGGVP